MMASRLLDIEYPMIDICFGPHAMHLSRVTLLYIQTERYAIICTG